MIDTAATVTTHDHHRHTFHHHEPYHRHSHIVFIRNTPCPCTLASYKLDPFRPQVKSHPWVTASRPVSATITPVRRRRWFVDYIRDYLHLMLPPPGRDVVCACRGACGMEVRKHLMLRLIAGTDADADAVSARTNCRFLSDTVALVHCYVDASNLQTVKKSLEVNVVSPGCEHVLGSG